MKLVPNTVLKNLKDDAGRIVIWQTPNYLLSGWILSKVATVMLDNSRLDTGFSQLGTALLFAWAYLEMSKGVNLFRKTLGTIILGLIIASFFA